MYISSKNKGTIIEFYIYGDGIVGKNLSSLFKILNIKFIMLDNKQSDFNDQLFVCKKNQYIFICTSKLTYQEMMLNILLKNGFSKKYIRYYAGAYFFEKSQKLITEQWINKNKFIDFIKQDTAHLTLLQKELKAADVKYENKLKKAKLEYSKIENQLYVKKQDIFTELYQSKVKGIDFKWYPYFMNQILNTSKDSFGFREKIFDNNDIDKCELICVFGDSQTYGVNVGETQTIPYLLEKKLNLSSKNIKYKIINCGINASTIMHQMQIYISIIEKFKPKIVISIFGFDLFNTYLNCEKMVSEHYLSYYSYTEKSLKSLYGSDTPLLGEARIINEKITDEDVIKTIQYRLEQFSKIVSAMDSRFIACLEPFLHKKQKRHIVEEDKYNEWLKNEGSNDFDILIKRIPDLIDNLNEVLDTNCFIKEYIDFNKLFSSQEEILFDDYIHLNYTGNKIFANSLGEYIIHNET